jgi:DNA-binding beta-propeller fold protein YncE
MSADIQDLNARLIDPERGVLSTRKLPGRPRWCTYSKETGRFLVLIRDPPAVVALDPRSGEVEAPRILNASGPHGVDVDEQTGTVYVACDSGVVLALDPKTLAEKARVRIAGEPDIAWFNPRRSYLYVALHKPGAIAVIDTNRMEVVQTVKTEEGAGTLAFDNSRQRLYTFLPKACQAAVYTES